MIQDHRKTDLPSGSAKTQISPGNEIRAADDQKTIRNLESTKSDALNQITTKTSNMNDRPAEGIYGNR